MWNKYECKFKKANFLLPKQKAKNFNDNLPTYHIPTYLL